VFGPWPANGLAVNAGVAAKGKSVLPLATLTNGRVPAFTPGLGLWKANIGATVTRAVPLLNVVTGISILVVIEYM